MTGWYLVLAPLAVLAVLVLSRFIGCASLLDIQDVSYIPGPSGPDYAKTVLSDNPVSYWRLQEKQGSQPPSPTVPNTPVSGGTATLNMYVYVRGVDLASDLAHPVKDLQNVIFSPVTDPGQSLLIGMHRPPVGSALPVYHPFKGKIQEVAIYDRALTIGRCPVSHVCAGLNL